MVVGPQLSTITAEFEERFVLDDGCNADGQHHEQSHSIQKSFFEDVCYLVATFEVSGNPFLDRSKDLVTIDTKDILPQAVVETVGKIHLRGANQYKSFIEERLLKNDTPISSTIAKNSFALFSKRKKVVKSNDKEKIIKLKSDFSLFSKLYIANQSREGNLEEFSKHKNQKFPPSLAEGGKLRQAKKADLLGCLESYCLTKEEQGHPLAEVRVLDGAAVIHYLPLSESRTFGEYARNVFVPNVTSELERSSRVDLLWDVYLKDSLKMNARENRGTGARRRVLPNVKLPNNWKKFLRNDDNKD